MMVTGLITLGVMNWTGEEAFFAVSSGITSSILAFAPPLCTWQVCWLTCLLCLPSQPLCLADVCCCVLLLRTCGCFCQALLCLPAWEMDRSSAIPPPAATWYSFHGICLSTCEEGDQRAGNLQCGPFWTRFRCARDFPVLREGRCDRKQTRVLVHIWVQCPHLVRQGRGESACPGNLLPALRPLLLMWSERSPRKGWNPSGSESWESWQRKSEQRRSVSCPVVPKYKAKWKQEFALNSFSWVLVVFLCVFFFNYLIDWALGKYAPPFPGVVLTL